MGCAVEVVQKVADQVGFTILPRRWAVERTAAWLCHHRRLSKDDEHHACSSAWHVSIASIDLLLNALTEPYEFQVRSTDSSPA